MGKTGVSTAATNVFITYDRQGEREVSALRVEIERQLRLEGFKNLNVLQDTEILIGGDDWRRNLTLAVHNSSLLIVAVTASLKYSEECQREIFLFNERAEQGAPVAIFPVLMRATPEIYGTESERQQAASLTPPQRKLVQILQKINYFDGRVFSTEAPDSPQYKVRTLELSRQIKAKLLQLERPADPGVSTADVGTVALEDQAAQAVSQLKARPHWPPSRRSIIVACSAVAAIGVGVFLISNSERPGPSPIWSDAKPDQYLRNETATTIQATQAPETGSPVVDYIQPGARRPIGANSKLRIGKTQSKITWYRYMTIDGKEAFVPASAIALK